MSKNAWQWMGRAFLVAAAAMSAGCGNDAPAGPSGESALRAPLAAAPTVAPDLGSCSDLTAPAGSQLLFHAYARGVQIYRWNGSSWAPVGPSATLYADAEGRAEVGTHYVGPTWQSASGSTVKAAVLEKCTVSPDAVPWLLLGATENGAGGVFQSVTHIQRVNTVGGNPPATGGSVGDEARIPYTAEYFFYRAP